MATLRHPSTTAPAAPPRIPRAIQRGLLTAPVIMVTAIVNGGIREAGYRDAVGNDAAHQISSLTFVIAVGALATWLDRRWRPSPREALGIGLTWVGAALAFEFTFGRLQGMSWSELFADYNLLKGRTWPLDLAFMAYGRPGTLPAPPRVLTGL